MKLRNLIAVCALSTLAANAQLPAHDRVVEKYPSGKGFFDVFKAWDENAPHVTDDDNFYISRVRLAERFVDVASQHDATQTQDRKMFWWCPTGVADSYWSSLPRYIFNADAFSAWSMIDIHGNWSDGVGRVPGAFSDAAHRNGVQNGCIFFFDSTGGGAGFGGSETQQFFSYLAIMDGNGEYPNCRKFIRFMKYYGLDGIGINPEAPVGSYASMVKNVLEKLHEYAPQEGWHFRVDWYDAQTNGGSTSWANALLANNAEWFQRTNKEWPVSDVYFLNYNWYASHLNNSVNTATARGRSSFDVYAGFDIQGRGLSSTSGGSAGNGWELLPNFNVSIGIWGAHGKNIIYENSNEYGSDAMSIQTLYQKKQEQFFWSGTRNIANAPAITNRLRSFGYNTLRSFHGMSRFLPARSTLNSLPFVTYFNLGNGAKLYDEGRVTFDQEWYNLGAQNMLPTWRWWITDDEGNVPAEAIEAEFSYNDAWRGGSVLKFSGKTTKSNVRLFKTQFDVAAADIVTLRYKKIGNGGGTMKLMWSADGSTLNTYEVPASTKGEWATLQLSAAELGMTGEVKVLGFVFENTDADYAVEIGEMGIVNATVFTPATPVITKAELCGQHYNTVDFKLIWQSKEPNANAWEPVYNDEVDTWYFEVFAQIEGQEPFLATTCTSWAAYVVGVPVGLDLQTRVRYGVRAVAPDGVTRSDIVWSEYEARSEQNLTISENVVVDKAVIKPGEQFTVKFEDPYHTAAKFQIINAATNEVVFNSQEKVLSITTSIEALGTYDVKVGSTTYPGLVCISPLSTGALPIIADLTVDREEAAIDENITATLTIERLGEGKVSRGLVIEDPTMLRFSSDMCSDVPFTVAFWIKPTSYAHGKFGTNLFNKRDWSGNWPHNNWGTIWMHIWPDVPVYSNINPNIASLTYWNTTDGASNYGSGGWGNGNKHESPNNLCMTNDLSLTAGQWYHVAFSFSSNEMSLFLNGKRVGTQSITWRGLNTQNACYGPQYCYIGGTNTYHGGFIGVIDDVQYWNLYTNNAADFLLDAMQGYSDREIPANLQGYWDFEDAPTAGTAWTENGTANTALSLFRNLGHNQSLQAETMYLEGASGENPDASSFAKFVDADNSVGGNPNLTGSIDVTTTTSWILPDDATDAPTDATNVMSFALVGEKPITARLENTWGFDERTVNVVIKANEPNPDPDPDPDHVNDVNATELRLQNGAITVLFADGGDYAITVSTLDGRNLQNQNITVVAGELVNLRLNATGACIVNVRGEGVNKTLKITL